MKKRIFLFLIVILMFAGIVVATTFNENLTETLTLNVSLKNNPLSLAEQLIIQSSSNNRPINLNEQLCIGANFTDINLLCTTPIVITKTTVTVTVVSYITTIIQPNFKQPNNTNDAISNQATAFIIYILPTLILCFLFIYMIYKSGIRNEKIYAFVFILIIWLASFVGLLNFGTNTTFWYIPIFITIIGFIVMFL